MNQAHVIIAARKLLRDLRFERDSLPRGEEARRASVGVTKCEELVAWLEYEQRNATPAPAPTEAATH